MGTADEVQSPESFQKETEAMGRCLGWGAVLLGMGPEGQEGVLQQKQGGWELCAESQPRALASSAPWPGVPLPAVNSYPSVKAHGHDIARPGFAWPGGSSPPLLWEQTQR